jgi:hypothetical protein
MTFADLQAITADRHFEPRFSLWYEHNNLLNGRLSAEELQQHRLMQTQIEVLRAGTSSAGRYTVQR